MSDAMVCQRPGCGASVATGQSVVISGSPHVSGAIRLYPQGPFRLCPACYGEYTARKLLALDEVLRVFMTPPPPPVDLLAFANAIANP